MREEIPSVSTLMCRTDRTRGATDDYVRDDFGYFVPSSFGDFQGTDRLCLEDGLSLSGNGGSEKRNILPSRADFPELLNSLSLTGEAVESTSKIWITLPHSQNALGPRLLLCLKMAHSISFISMIFLMESFPKAISALRVRCPCFSRFISLN